MQGKGFVTMAARGVHMPLAAVVLLSLAACGPVEAPPEKKATGVNFTDAMGMLYHASSELEAPPPGEFGRYGAQNLFDKDKATCWAEGTKGPGIGEFIYVRALRGSRGIRLVNGYAKSAESYSDNSRPRELRLSLHAMSMPEEGRVTESSVPVGLALLKGVEPSSATLKDISEPQSIYFPEAWRETLAGEAPLALKVEISSVYKGAKYEDTCLSELAFFKVTAARVNEAGDTVLLDRDGTVRAIIRDPGSVFQVLTVDPVYGWVIVIRMSAEAGPRAETEYLLLDAEGNILNGRLPPGTSQLYGFDIRDRKRVLKAAGPGGEDIFLDLRKIQEEK